MNDDTQTTGNADAPVTTDTAPAQASSADVQVDQDAPEATQDVKDSAVTATDTAEEKLYAGKYKSVEDMEKAYQELNSKFSTTAQEKAELSKILNEAFTNVDQPGQAADEIDPYIESASTPDVGLQRDVAVMKFMLAHEDADASSMKEVLASDPMVNQMTSFDAKLEYAYLRSQNMTKPKAIAEAQKQAAQATQAKIAEKQTAQVETAKTAEKPDEQSELRQRMASGSMQDREAARRQYIRKYLV